MTSFQSTYLSTALLNHVLRATPYTPPANVYLGLLRALPGKDGTGGNEVDGAGYVRPPLAMAPAASSTITTSANVTYPKSQAPWGTVVALGVFDAEVGGNLLWAGEWSSGYVVEKSFTLTLEAGSLTISYGQDEEVWSAKTDYLANALLNHVFRGVVYPSPANIYLGLFENNWGGGWIGEITHSGRRANLTGIFGAPSSGVAVTSTLMEFVRDTVGWGSWPRERISIFDAQSGGNELWQTYTTPITHSKGEQVYLLAGAGAASYGPVPFGSTLVEETVGWPVTLSNWEGVEAASIVISPVDGYLYAWEHRQYEIDKQFHRVDRSNGSSSSFILSTTATMNASIPGGEIDAAGEYLYTLTDASRLAQIRLSDFVVTRTYLNGNSQNQCRASAVALSPDGDHVYFIHGGPVGFSKYPVSSSTVVWQRNPAGRQLHTLAACPVTGNIIASSDIGGTHICTPGNVSVFSDALNRNELRWTGHPFGGFVGVTESGEPFIERKSATGTTIWSQSIVGTSSILSVCVDKFGDVYAVSQAGGGPQRVIRKYDGGVGTLLWTSAAITGASGTTVMKVDTSGNLFLGTTDTGQVRKFKQMTI